VAISGFSDLRAIQFLRFADFRYICRPNYFFELPQIRKYNIIFLFTIISLAFRSLKCTYVGKKILSKPMRIRVRNTAFYIANLRICDLRLAYPFVYSTVHSRCENRNEFSGPNICRDKMIRTMVALVSSLLYF
jgi:hypothetical protein